MAPHSCPLRLSTVAAKFVGLRSSCATLGIDASRIRDAGSLRAVALPRDGQAGNSGPIETVARSPPVGRRPNFGLSWRDLGASCLASTSIDRIQKAGGASGAQCQM